MSILRRMRDMTVATLNERLEQSEDPVRLIDRYLIEQRQHIQEAERLYTQAMHHAQTLRQHYLTAEQYKEKREQQALVALKAGEDEVARLALHEKMQHEEKSNQYRELYEQSKQAILELEDQLRQLKADHDEVAAKRSYYMARIETARLQQRMNNYMGSTGFNPTPRMFNRLEDRVSDMEMEARSLSDLRKIGREAMLQVGMTLNTALDQELNKLKQKLEKEGWSSK
ncbi:PspA/IM30 family protein [Paenibacillus contaminans]|uniref:PspA/IM30 family protein n=1 Tax=Paenibacillus contaminans TaxID=450362 RepID=A0A329MHA0_9BACL|nr:PspA/IM30 family protein [Paenibacillus contaminans]RAV19214.1 PspA/IM30 family protein [Paenibacillus contaminans]